MTNLKEAKSEALNAYKAAKAAYLKDQTPENWKTFCIAKTNCMKLGVII